MRHFFPRIPSSFMFQLTALSQTGKGFENRSPTSQLYGITGIRVRMDIIKHLLCQVCKWCLRADLYCFCVRKWHHEHTPCPLLLLNEYQMPKLHRCQAPPLRCVCWCASRAPPIAGTLHFFGIWCMKNRSGGEGFTISSLPSQLEVVETCLIPQHFYLAKKYIPNSTHIIDS